MSYKLERVPGMTTDSVRRLATVGIVSTGSLLIQCATEECRARIALQTGVDEQELAHWASLVDLGRISGIGLLTAERLLACGVSSVESLGKRRTDELAQALIRTDDAHGHETVSIGRLARWIEQAHRLRPMLS